MPKRDPDDLLEAFAEMTVREPGQFVPSARGPIVRRLVTVAVALVLVATIGGLAAIYGPRLAPAGVPEATLDPATAALPQTTKSVTATPLGDASGHPRTPPVLLPTPSAIPVVTPGAQSEAASWAVDGAAPIGPESTSVRLLVRHDVCQLDHESIGTLQPPELDYRSDAVVISTRVLPTARLLSCADAMEERVVVPVLVELAEPLGDRVLADGIEDPPLTRWRAPPADAIRLPTLQSDPWPLGIAFWEWCRGVGYEDSVIAGAPDDPRLVWVETGQGQSNPNARWVWPAGFTVRFSEGVEILNPAGDVMSREGDRVDGACVGRDSSGDVLCLCGLDRLILHPHERAIGTALNDPLLGDYLERHPHGAPVVSETWTVEPVPDRVLLVTIGFAEFADDYPLDSCDIAREIDHVTGVAWMIDPAEDEILARTPIWPGEIDCFA